jgi:hypothetical protein
MANARNAKNLFKKNRSLDVSPDFAAFYQDNNQAGTAGSTNGADVNKGVAALMGFMTLCAAMLLVLGLFFGARWIYRSTQNDSKPVVVDTTTDAQGVVATADGGGASITIDDKAALDLSNDKSKDLAKTPAAADDTKSDSKVSGASTTTTSTTLPSTADKAPISTIPDTGVTFP